MKQKPKTMFRLMAGVAVVSGLLASCSDGYDLAEKDPEWLGSSIYDYLSSEGNFTQTVRLIDDLGYGEVLAKTGSKTLFVANDEAFGRFYQNNTWGVRSYEDLTMAQKKLLLYGSMINNACQVAYLSSSEGPVEGDCMRRLTASSEYDSIPVISPANMPEGPYWQYYRDHDKAIACANDFTAPPMVHFIEQFLQNKLITNADCNFLNNYADARIPGDAHVNGVKMSNQNIKCSNGFVHEMAEVTIPQPNMAQYVTQTAELSQFAKLLNRFCAPYYAGKTATDEYNRLNPSAPVDSLFEKRYFSERSHRGMPLDLTPADAPVNGMLKFDPGWNEYYTGVKEGVGNVTIQRDMAVMMVPSNEALIDFWQNGAGRSLREYYGSWDKVTDQVVAELINVNMLSSFVQSVPSKFQNILNDANDPMGVDVKDIESVHLACNGAIYLTNKVYSPTTYRSVLFPPLINEVMAILYWGVKQLNYNVYLNSLNSYYSFFVPNNKGMLEYIDPCSYGKPNLELLRFHYDKSLPEDLRVWASKFKYDAATQTIGDSIGEIRDNYTIKNRIRDILETHIVVGNVEDGAQYYRTKGGTEIRVANTASGKNGMTVEGSYQINDKLTNKKILVSDIYDQSPEKTQGNGKTYVLDSEPIMTTHQSVRDVIDAVPEFSYFRDLLDGSSLLEDIRDNHATASKNISTFNTFHYTVYIPTNESIKALQDAGKLPTWEKVSQYRDAGMLTEMERDSALIENFLRYHIQDNAVFIGAKNEDATYETAFLNLELKKFYRVDVQSTDNSITLVDEANNTAHVVTTDSRLYNLQAREFQYDANDPANANNIETTSSAVIHLIDQPLKVYNSNGVLYGN